MVLFTILFGLSFSLQMRRAASHGHPFFRLQVRRLLVLLLIGLAHAHLLWYGGILFSYALAGMLLLLFHDCRPTRLVWALVPNLGSFSELEFRTLRALDRSAHAERTEDAAPQSRARTPSSTGTEALARSWSGGPPTSGPPTLTSTASSPGGCRSS